MKKILSVFIVIILCFSCFGCSKEAEPEIPEVSIKKTQMKAICELATMDCYYHNVAKYHEDKATSLWGTGLFSKDRDFWVEYAGVVTVGIDASRLEISVEGDIVTITMPPAEIQGCKVDENTLNEDSFIVAKGSAKIEAEHQTKAFQEAQKIMLEAASNDTTILASAQQRAEKLLTDYVNNIGNQIGKTYTINWVYVE